MINWELFLQESIIVRQIDMPLTIITLSKCPRSLRGDLTKWMQEIDTGVYVGNLNSRIREKLWSRVSSCVGSGSATLSFVTQNEIGYDFCTINSARKVVYLDGIPLIFTPNCNKRDDIQEHGFSKAYHFHKARMYSNKKLKKDDDCSLDPTVKDENVYTAGDFEILSDKKFVILDIETSGLNEIEDKIIEIGAIRICNKQVDDYQCLIKRDSLNLSPAITQLTGLTDIELANRGVSPNLALNGLKQFIGHLPVLGYNIAFDMRFINNELRSMNEELLDNREIDVMRFIKKEKMFLESYALDNVLKVYGISASVPHRALGDAKLIAKLALKVNKILDVL